MLSQKSKSSCAGCDYGVATISRLLKMLSLWQKSPIKETILCKRGAQRGTHAFTKVEIIFVRAVAACTQIIKKVLTTCVQVVQYFCIRVRACVCVRVCVYQKKVLMICVHAVQHMGHSRVLLPMRSAHSAHTHTCPHGTKANCFCDTIHTTHSLSSCKAWCVASITASCARVSTTSRSNASARCSAANTRDFSFFACVVHPCPGPQCHALVPPISFFSHLFHYMPGTDTWTTDIFWDTCTPVCVSLSLTVSVGLSLSFSYSLPLTSSLSQLLWISHPHCRCRSRSRVCSCSSCVSVSLSHSRSSLTPLLALSLSLSPSLLLPPTLSLYLLLSLVRSRTRTLSLSFAVSLHSLHLSVLSSCMNLSFCLSVLSRCVRVSLCLSVLSICVRVSLCLSCACSLGLSVSNMRVLSVSLCLSVSITLTIE